MEHLEKKYWFYLEPYSFIFIGDEQYVIYNSLNSAYISSNSNKLINSKIQSLLADGSGYSTEITCNDLKDEHLSTFIKKVRASFSGDIVCQEKGIKKPFIFKPILRLIDNFHHIRNQDEEYFRLNILKCLKEITLYITNSCDQSCKNCSLFYKQTLFCTKQPKGEDIEMSNIIQVLERIEKAGTNLVNITGGNIFKYKYLFPLIPILANYGFKKRFYIHYRNISDIIREIPLDGNFSFVVLINFDDFDESSLIKAAHLCDGYDVEFLFLVESEDNYVMVDKFMEESKIKTNININIKPFYNKENLKFFQKNVFIDWDDILYSDVNKQTIFRRKTLNENFFGHLLIATNGDVYSNINYSPIGNILEGDTFNKIVSKEVNTNISWFKTRDSGACKKCCNKYLCPSPSNYEIVLNRENLCNIISS